MLRKRRAQLDSSLLQSDQRMVSDSVEMNVVVEVSAKSEDSLDSDSTSVIVSIDEFNKTVGVSSEESAHESAAEPPTSYEPQDVLKEFCVTSAVSCSNLSYYQVVSTTYCCGRQ